MKRKRIFICLLALCLLVCSVGCSDRRSHDLNELWDGERKDGDEYVPDGVQYQPRTDTVVYDFDVTSDPFAAAQMSLAVALLKGTVALNDYDASTLISPLSIAMALSMASNGADGRTREQMLSLLSNGLTQQELNEGMRELRQRILGRLELVSGDDRSLPTVNIANSLWLRESDDVTFSEEFLQTNRDVYAADAFMRDFGEATVGEINDWVNEQTDGMIPSVIDRLDEQDMLVLINTLFFEGRWDDPFTKAQIESGTFTAADGTRRDAQMLCDTDYYYLDDGRAQGFMKYYEGCDYAFVALLPDEGLTVAEYVAGMDADAMLAMLRDTDAAEGIWCRYQLPKFEIDYNDGGRLDAVLKSLGMTDAYSFEDADFGGIGEMASEQDNIYLDSIVHKTTMSVDENGTRAAAVTAARAPGSPMPTEIKQLTFDRPFVCMIVEVESGIPLFMGTVMDIQ